MAKRKIDIIKLIHQHRWLAVALFALLAGAAAWLLLANSRGDRSASEPSSSTTPAPLSSPASPSPALSPATSTGPDPAAAGKNFIKDVYLLEKRGLRFAELDSKTKRINFYSDRESTLNSFDLQKRQSTTLASDLPIVNRLVWSPNRATVILEAENSPNDNQVAESFKDSTLPEGYTLLISYTIADKKVNQLNRAIINSDFIGDDSIIYQYRDDQFNNLSIAQHDGTDWRNIARLNGEVRIKRYGKLAVVDGLNQQRLTVFDPSGKQVREIRRPEGFILDQSDWPSDSPTALYWTKINDKVNFSTLTNAGEVKALGSLSIAPGEIQFMWDNVTEKIYLIDDNGIAALKDSN